MDAPKVRQCHNALNEFGGCVEYTRVLIVLWQGDRSLGGLAMQLHTGYNVTYDEVDLVERHKSAGGVGNITSRAGEPTRQHTELSARSLNNTPPRTYYTPAKWVKPRGTIP